MEKEDLEFLKKYCRGSAGINLKLGAGGLSDVEWTVQLLQLQHAGRHPGLRTTATLFALTAA